MIEKCKDCIEISERISEEMGFGYHTLCLPCREAAVKKYQPIKPSRSKSYTDYSEANKRRK